MAYRPLWLAKQDEIPIALAMKKISLCLLFLGSFSYGTRLKKMRRAGGEWNTFDRLGKLQERYWKYRWKEYPEFATSVGHPGQDRRWTDLSDVAIPDESGTRCAVESLQGIRSRPTEPFGNS